MATERDYDKINYQTNFTSTKTFAMLLKAIKEEGIVNRQYARDELFPKIRNYDSSKRDTHAEISLLQYSLIEKVNENEFKISSLGCRFLELFNDDLSIKENNEYNYVSTMIDAIFSWTDTKNNRNINVGVLLFNLLLDSELNYYITAEEFALISNSGIKTNKEIKEIKNKILESRKENLNIPLKKADTLLTGFANPNSWNILETEKLDGKTIFKLKDISKKIIIDKLKQINALQDFDYKNEKQETIPPNSLQTEIQPIFNNSIQIPLIDSSFGKDIEDSELIKILGNELKKSREQAEKEQENISTALHVFAIQFAPVIKERKLSCRDIVEVAGVTESQQVEITKGINIYNKFASIYPLKKNIKKTNLYHFKENTTQENFILDKFKDNPIYKRYIISLLAKPFVILAGISGSGKTKIATDFAKWLKKSSIEDSEITNSLLVSVGSDWTDNTKILGYYNSIKEEYFKTEIIELIERANANENIPFFLILDEMNLSRVERYFSDFLSKMEENSDEIFFNIEKYKNEQGIEGKLKFPKNLFIIGTVNIDETTYMFSPKVLDRANVIEFTPDNVMKNFENDLSAEDITPASDGIAESFLKLALSIRQTDILDDSAKEKATDILNKIYKIFEENGKEFGFAYRTVKEIRHYINASVKLGFKDITEAMDEQVLQKILPKIHGNRKQLEILLERLKTTCEENGLTNSSNKIISMQQKLSTNQFASFI